MHSERWNCPLVVSDLEILGGDPVFRGTRVPVHLIALMLECGSTEADILKAYPRVTAKMVRSAPAYAQARAPTAFCGQRSSKGVSRSDFVAGDVNGDPAVVSCHGTSRSRGPAAPVSRARTKYQSVPLAANSVGWIKWAFQSGTEPSGTELTFTPDFTPWNCLARLPRRRRFSILEWPSPPISRAARRQENHL